VVTGLPSRSNKVTVRELSSMAWAMALALAAAALAFWSSEFWLCPRGGAISRTVNRAAAQVAIAILYEVLTATSLFWSAVLRAGGNDLAVGQGNDAHQSGERMIACAAGFCGNHLAHGVLEI